MQRVLHGVENGKNKVIRRRKKKNNSWFLGKSQLVLGFPSRCPADANTWISAVSRWQAS